MTGKIERYNFDLSRKTMTQECNNVPSSSTGASTTAKNRNTRSRLIPVSALMLSLLIVSSTSSSSTFLTNAIQMQTFGDGETPPVLLSSLLPSALAKTYERNAIDNRLDMRDSRLYEGDQPSQPSTPNTTPIIEDQGEGGEDIITPTAINAGDLVHVLWQDNTPGNLDILYKRDGADFDPTTINLSSNAGSSFNPAIAVSGNNVHVVWSDDTSGNPEILYRRSTDGGATFGPIINLSNTAGISDESAIAVSGNNVYVVWHDVVTQGNFDILYKRSTDGGASFTEPIKNLSGNAGQSTFPAIAVSGNDVHVVWDDFTPGNLDILYRRSVDGGTTFPNVIKNLSSNTGQSVRPAIAVSGNNVHVIWVDNTSGDILYRRSLDSGTTFPNVIKNLSSNLGSSSDPGIAVSGNNVHVVWRDDTPGNFDILYRRSVDGGTTFPNIIKNLSANVGSSMFPAIAQASSNVYVVWQDTTSGNNEILYRTSANNGDTFPSILTNLSANAGSSNAPAIAVTST